MRTAWIYQADEWHPKCCLEHLVRERKASPAARDMDPEEALRQIVESNGFDYSDEYSWDTDDLPKSVLHDWSDHNEESDCVCAACGRRIG